MRKTTWNGRKRDCPQSFLFLWINRIIFQKLKRPILAGAAFFIFAFPLFRKHCILSCILIGSAASHLRPPASAGRFFYRCRRIACQAAVCAYHAMTGHNDGNRVVSNRAADSLRAHAAAQQRAVCRRLPIRNFEQALPDAPSEIRTDQMQRRREIRLSACKIDIQPARRFIQKSACAFLRALQADWPQNISRR